MPVTLKDVAHHAGVSIKTVSNVVNGLGRMSDETRARVQTALVELNYQPNLPARYLRHSSVGIITLAIPDFTGYFAEIGDEIIKAAAARNYTVLVDTTEGQRIKEAQVINGLRPHLIDGVILNPMELEPADLIENVRIPTILLGERLIDAPYDHVMINNVAAAYLATQHLIEQGRTRIAAIGSKTSEQATDNTSRLRIEGYKKALQDSGIAIDETLIKPARSYSRAYGAAVMRELLALAQPPNALFCFNDLLALGAMHTVHEHGLRIPEDIAIVGFDDIEEGHYSYPTLTSISPDKPRIARTALDFLIGRIQGTRTDSAQHVMDMPFELKVRQSSVGRASHDLHTG